MIEDIIPITRKEARVADFNRPFRWCGFDWWVRESPVFDMWQDTTFVRAVRKVESWEKIKEAAE